MILNIPELALAKPTRVDGFVIGLMPAIGWRNNPKDYLPAYRDQMNPGKVPFSMGDIVTKGFTRPSDLTQTWMVVGLYFNGYSNGWNATICRDGVTDLHCNSLYSVGANRLFKIP